MADSQRPQRGGPDLAQGWEGRDSEEWVQRQDQQRQREMGKQGGEGEGSGGETQRRTAEPPRSLLSWRRAVGYCPPSGPQVCKGPHALLLWAPRRVVFCLPF